MAAQRAVTASKAPNETAEDTTMTVHSEALIEKFRSFVCLSSDDKPSATSVNPPQSGDTLFERDTGRLFWWDGARWVWRPHGAGCIAKMTGDAVTRNSDNSTDAQWEAMDSFVIPGGLLGPSFRLMIQAVWSMTSSANQKQMTARLGSQGLGIGSATTSVAASLQHQVWGRNSMTAQRVFNNTSWHNAGTANAMIDTTEDMNQDQTIPIECRWVANVAGESITLEDWFALVMDVGYDG